MTALDVRQRGIGPVIPNGTSRFGTTFLLLLMGVIASLSSGGGRDPWVRAGRGM